MRCPWKVRCKVYLSSALSPILSFSPTSLKTHTHIHTRARARIRTYTHVHTYTHTRTHTHTRARACAGARARAHTHCFVRFLSLLLLLFVLMLVLQSLFSVKRSIIQCRKARMTPTLVSFLLCTWVQPTTWDKHASQKICLYYDVLHKLWGGGGTSVAFIKKRHNSIQVFIRSAFLPTNRKRDSYFTSWQDWHNRNLSWSTVSTWNKSPSVRLLLAQLAPEPPIKNIYFFLNQSPTHPPLKSVFFNSSRATVDQPGIT